MWLWTATASSSTLASSSKPTNPRSSLSLHLTWPISRMVVKKKSPIFSYSVHSFKKPLHGERKYWDTDTYLFAVDSGEGANIWDEKTQKEEHCPPSEPCPRCTLCSIQEMVEASLYPYTSPITMPHSPHNQLLIRMGKSNTYFGTWMQRNNNSNINY